MSTQNTDVSFSPIEKCQWHVVLGRAAGAEPPAQRKVRPSPAALRSKPHRLFDRTGGARLDRRLTAQPRPVGRFGEFGIE